MIDYLGEKTEVPIDWWTSEYKEKVEFLDQEGACMQNTNRLAKRITDNGGNPDEWRAVYALNYKRVKDASGNRYTTGNLRMINSNLREGEQIKLPEDDIEDIQEMDYHVFLINVKDQHAYDLTCDQQFWGHTFEDFVPEVFDLEDQNLKLHVIGLSELESMAAKQLIGQGTPIDEIREMTTRVGDKYNYRNPIEGIMKDF